MKIKATNISLKAILITIAIGIWAIFLQNAGIIPTSQKVRVVNTVDTHVNGGDVDANVSGYVDVNIAAINGYSNAFYDHTYKHPGKHYRLPVYTGQ